MSVASAAKPAASTCKHKILIVDDQADNVDLLDDMLTSEDYRTVAVHSAMEALSFAQGENPPMVITDWLMPEMDGLELCRRLRSDRRLGYPYIIVVTANTDRDALSQAFASGADDFLAKPVNRKELLSRVHAGMRIIDLQTRLRRANRRMKQLNGALTDANEKLARMAMVDELTGLLNLRAMRDRVKEIWSIARRQGQPLSCIMIDIDHFKKINDTYGHGAGDAVLRQMADLLRQTSRTGDPLCRVGGEEFLVICPQTTGANACIAAERFRVAMEVRPFDIGDRTLKVTLSAGVAEILPDMTSATEMIRQADDALYRAKEGGRNRVARAETILMPVEPVA